MPFKMTTFNPARAISLFAQGMAKEEQKDPEAFMAKCMVTDMEAAKLKNFNTMEFSVFQRLMKMKGDWKWYIHHHEILEK
jgi:hypothetical protein